MCNSGPRSTNGHRRNTSASGRQFYIIRVIWHKPAYRILSQYRKENWYHGSRFAKPWPIIYLKILFQLLLILPKRGWFWIIDVYLCSQSTWKMTILCLIPRRIHAARRILYASILVFLFECVRKHTSCARDDKRLPSEYALTSLSFSRWDKVYSDDCGPFSCVYYLGV